MNGDERSHFDALYRKRSHFGGLPFVLLRDRFEFLREGVLFLWEDPTDGARVGALLRLLEYYGVMAAKRRESDRRYKAIGHHRTAAGRASQFRELNHAGDNRVEPLREDFRQIAEVLRTRRGDTCECGTASRWKTTAFEGDREDPSKPVTIEGRCEKCGYQEAFRATWDQIRDAGREE